MPEEEDSIATVLKREDITNDTSKEEKETESPKLQEFAPIDEMINSLKAAFLASDGMGLPEIVKELKVKIEELEKTFGTEEEKNNTEVDKILESKGPTLSTVGNKE